MYQLGGALGSARTSTDQLTRAGRHLCLGHSVWRVLLSSMCLFSSLWLFLLTFQPRWLNNLSDIAPPRKRICCEDSPGIGHECVDQGWAQDSLPEKVCP